MKQNFDVLVIGAAIVDILASPADISVFAAGSSPMNRILMDTGGDALNEALFLNHLGISTGLISKLGDDLAGDTILSHCRSHNLDTSLIRKDPETVTGINIVLVDKEGERYFLTNPNGSLRKLTLSDIPVTAFCGVPLISFAGIFIFPDFSGDVLVSLFQKIKETGAVLCCDLTKPKNGETITDISDALGYVDYLFPNYEEAVLITEETDLDAIADTFLSCGVDHIIIKTGADGCFIKTQNQRLIIPACASAACVDTTGAGDSFAAGFIYGILHGYSLADCGRFANACASFIIEHVGATSYMPALADIKTRCITY